MAEHWFRSYHGAPTDPKWIVIARKAGVAPGMVAAIWWALMDAASQATPRGSVADFDVESLAAFYGWDETQCNAVYAAIREKRMIDKNDMLSAWLKRNPKREDDSTDRVRKYREQKKLENEPKKRNAVKRTVTPDKKRRDVKQIPPKSPKGAYTPEFESAWQEYPVRAGGNSKVAAARAWQARIKEGYTPQAMLEGIRRYAAFIHATGKLRTEYVKQAATFLGPALHFTERWAPPAPENGKPRPGSQSTGIRNEQPQHHGGRQPKRELTRVGADQEDEAAAVDRWKREHPAEATQLLKQCAAELVKKPEWATVDEQFVKAAAEGECRKRIREKLAGAA